MEGLIGNVTLETVLTRPVSFDLELKESEPSAILGFLKPKITLVTVFGEEEFVPYGQPGTGMQGFLGLGLLATGLMVVSIIIYKTVK